MTIVWVSTRQQEWKLKVEIMTECFLSVILFALVMNQGQPPICAFVDNLRMYVDLAPGSGCARMLSKPTKVSSFQENKSSGLVLILHLRSSQKLWEDTLWQQAQKYISQLEDWLKEVDNKISLPGKFQTWIYHCGILTWSGMMQSLYRTVSLQN